MNANVSRLLLLATSGLLGCFHEIGALPTGAERARVLGFTVKDASGTAWPLDSAPRSPTFELTFETPPSMLGATVPVYLVDALPSDDLLADLSDPPVRKESAAQLHSLGEAQLSSGRLFVRPQASLAPSGRYALVWAGADDTQVFPFSVSSSPAAGAAFVQSFPSPQSRDVPTNLRRMLLRFDGYLATLPDAVLRDALGREVQVRREVVECADLGFESGHCIWLHWETPLAPQRIYNLAVTNPLVDATGAALEVPPLSFETGLEADASPPSLIAGPCALDEHPLAQSCLLASEQSVKVRAQVSEPVFAELLALPEKRAVLSARDPLEIALSGLPPENVCRFLRLTDLAQNRVEFPLCVALPANLATLTIDEVRADPLGPEPAQEYVELLNFGTEAVAMSGFTLSADPFGQGQVLSMEGAILPKERVLVVGPGFDRMERSDAKVPDSVRLIRLERSLALANDGALLILRDERGQRLAEVPALAAQRSGQCVARLADKSPRSSLLQDFSRDPDRGCTPGAPSFETALGESEASAKTREPTMQP